jgi:hypothetical protein
MFIQKKRPSIELKQYGIDSRMWVTIFSQLAEIHAKYLGDLQKLKDLYIDQDVEQLSISSDLKINPGFSMLLVQAWSNQPKVELLL